jgi:hypothetical protein
MEAKHITNVTLQRKWSHVPLFSIDNEKIRHKPLDAPNGDIYALCECYATRGCE